MSIDVNARSVPLKPTDTMAGVALHSACRPDVVQQKQSQLEFSPRYFSSKRVID